jgi:hypothetical protein
MDRIYDLHHAAFKAVEAYVVMQGSELVGRIAFKRGASGKVWCYLDLFGARMVRGGAGGGGYDKHSAAFYEAVTRLPIGSSADAGLVSRSCLVRLAAKAGAGASHWDSAMRDNGFAIHQAV